MYPCMDSVTTVDMRTQTYDINPQSVSIRAASLENLFSGFPTRSDTNLAVGIRPQKIARGFKFRI